MFADYHFAQESELPPFGNRLYEYWVAANGIFVRAERPGLKALIVAAAVVEPIKGLAPLRPFVDIGTKAPAVGLARMIEWSRRCAPREALFYLTPDPWRLVMPAQIRDGGHVRPVDPYDEYAAKALIEVHSHHDMAAFFSGTDNKDERGFRVYGVLGSIRMRPAISVRVGIYGHFQIVPARDVFDGMPAGLRDANFPTLEEEEQDESELRYEPINDYA